jgi:hypothetical protein
MPPDRVPLSSSRTGARATERLEPHLADVATWLGQFARTLKTCRLYEARNPNTVRFREELAGSLGALLERHGSFRLEFTADQVLCDEQAVATATSRDDNFAMPFFRDGLYALSFRPGMEPAELERLLDILLRVTARAAEGREDLVTLLWDADLPHLGVSYVSAETDTGLDDAADPLPEDAFTPRGRLMPWPAREAASESGEVGAGSRYGSAGQPGSVTSGAFTGDSANEPPGAHSEDWPIGEPEGELDRAYASLDATSAEDVDAFMTRMHLERGEPVAMGAIALVRDALQAQPNDQDRDDFVELLERVLRDAIAGASWAEAGEAVACLGECTADYWDATLLAQEFAEPESVVTNALVRRLDEAPIAETTEFAAFVRGLGASSIEWLMGIVALASQQRTRRVLLRTLIEMCAGNPERLAPWVGDPRWFVVRNAVHVIGAVEGGVPVGMFAPLVNHPETRVRREVVTALANAEPDDAQPLLLLLMHDPDPSVRWPALHRLGSRRDARVSKALLRMVSEPGFRKLPEEEIRPVLLALGNCSLDDALPALEEQLFESSGFLGGSTAYQQAIARCIARIGTPAAQVLLENGARSRHASVREACRLVLKGSSHA